MATARKLPSGNYRALIYVGTENGKRKYKSFTAPTKKEAERLASSWSYEDKHAPITDYTINEAVDAYCNLKSNVLSPSTLLGYRKTKNYFGNFGSTKLSKVNSDSVQRFINGFSADHAPKTVRNVYGLISAVMYAYAPDIRLKVTLPQKVRPDLYVPSDSDVQALIRYFIEKGDKDMEIAVYLAAFGTLRRSEICALTAEDVRGKVISVNKAIVDSGRSEWVTKTTKTVSSTRFVEMPDFVIKEFPATGKLVQISPMALSKRFQKAVKKIRINHMRFHDLRHYSASIMHALGVPDVYIMQRGGWSSDYTLKNIYRGSIDDYQKKFTDLTNAHFSDMQHEMQHDYKRM